AAQKRKCSPVAVIVTSVPIGTVASGDTVPPLTVNCAPGHDRLKQSTPKRFPLAARSRENHRGVGTPNPTLDFYLSWMSLFAILPIYPGTPPHLIYASYSNPNRRLRSTSPLRQPISERCMSVSIN